MNFQEAKQLIKSNFNELVNFKERGSILEVITGFTTLNDKIISVFIKIQNNHDFVITDGGWVENNFYENPIYEDSEDQFDKVMLEYLSSFDIKKKTNQSGIGYYYKKCDAINQIAGCVYDLANFLVGIINIRFVQFKDKVEETERDNFRQKATSFLKANIAPNQGIAIYFGQGLEDQKSVRFSSIINKNSKLYLISYITGSNQYYFENTLKRAIVNFEVSMKSLYNSEVKERLSIVNDEAGGYNPLISAPFLDLLKEKTTKEPIVWTRKESLLEFI